MSQHADRDTRAGPPARPSGHRQPPPAAQRPGNQVEALAQPVAGHLDVVRLVAGRHQRVARADDVPAADRERVEAEDAGQLVQGGFHGEPGLGQPVPAERAGRDRVRVGSPGVDPLGRAAVQADRLVAAVEQHTAGVVAVRAGVGDRAQLHRGQRAVPARPEPDRDPHRVPGRGRGELLLPGELQLHRLAEPQHGQRDHVLGEHLLLAAEPAADPRGEHPDLAALQPEQPAQRVPGQERGLRAGPQHQPPAVHPADRGVGLQVHVLYPLHPERLLVRGVRGRETCGQVPGSAVNFSRNVPFRVTHARAGRDPGCSTGAPGAMARSGSRTAGSTS